jgi:hypothetical protein
MDTTTALAVGCATAALVLLVLQQLFFALAVTALLREGRAETGAFDALRERLAMRLEETETRLRRVERLCDTGGPRITDAERVTPRGFEERRRRVSTINENQTTPQVVHNVDCDAWAWPEPEGEARPTTPAQDKKPPSLSCADEAPRAAVRPSASAPLRLHRRPAAASPSMRRSPSAGDAETLRSVFDRPNMRVSSGGRLQGMSSSRSSTPSTPGLARSAAARLSDENQIRHTDP